MKKLAILMTALMVITLTMGVATAEQKKAAAPATASAEVEMMSGEVVHVDAAAGTIVIKGNDKDHTLKAEPNLLKGCIAGDKVDAEVSGDTLKSIKKVEAPK